MQNLKHSILFMIFFPAIFLLIQPAACAQNYQWATGIEGNDFSTGAGIALDRSGDIYYTGTFTAIGDFDPGPGSANLVSEGGSDIFIAKYTASGNYEWAISIGGASNDGGSCIITDDNDNIYLVGYFRDTVDFDPGPGTSDIISSGGQDIFIAKYDPNGNYLWAKGIGGAETEGVFGLTSDTDGNIFLTGFYSGTVDFDPGSGTANLTAVGTLDIFFAKYDADGNYNLAKSIGGKYDDLGYSIAIDADANIYITGTYGHDADFDPGSGSAPMKANGPEIFFAKYDKSGDFLWANNIRSYNNDMGMCLKLDYEGNIYITGKFAAPADFDPGPGTATLSPVGNYNYDIFLAKYDNDGKYLWAIGMGSIFYGDYGTAIALDDMGNICITGTFVETADFDPGTGTANLTSAGDRDIFLAQYDADGNYLWAIGLGGSQDDGVSDVVVDERGNIYLTGGFQGSVDFDPGADTAMLTGQYFDGFIAKYSLDNSNLGFQAPQIATSLSISPNPFTTKATVVLTEAFQTGNSYYLVLYDHLGREVKRIEALSPAFILDREGLPAGLYYYYIAGIAGGASSGKVVVAD
ncbi:MAG: hypothetical protein M3Q97_04335 [Bacteroidota bacterium]|nr:hypothetical protein [Bacteroidota bacterium]